MKTLAPRLRGVRPALFLAAHAEAGVCAHLPDPILDLPRCEPGTRST